jgi:hypothetical protein
MTYAFDSDKLHHENGARIRVAAAAAGMDKADGFSDEELALIEARWRLIFYQYSLPVFDIKREDGKLRLDTKNDSHIITSKEQLELKGAIEEDDLTIRASLEFFKQQWPNTAAQIKGSDSFLFKTWVQARILDVAIENDNYTPAQEHLNKDNFEIITDRDDPDREKLRGWVEAKLGLAKDQGYTPTSHQLAKLRVIAKLPEKATPSPPGTTARAQPLPGPAA